MRSKQHRVPLLGTSVLLSALCVIASEPPSGFSRTARRLVRAETAAPAKTERGGVSQATPMPAVQVDVYFTQGSPARPVGFQKDDAGELWFLETPESGYGNLVHLLADTPADSSFEMSPTQTSVAPDTYSATQPSVFTMSPRKSAASSVANTVSGDSAGAFIRYQIPTIDGWACDLEARDDLFFTERYAARIGRFDPESSRFEEWDVPTPNSYPVGLLVAGDTVFFVEADSCRLGRLVVSDSSITEWDIPNAGYDNTGYPGLDRDGAGNLWLTSKLAPHLLVEVEIGAGDTARFSEWAVPGFSSEGPIDVVLDRDGRAWYSINRGDTNKIGVLDPAGQQYREWSVSDTDAGVYYLELDPDGCVWVGETHGSAVARLSPSANEVTTYPTILSHEYVYDFALDDKGNVWVACYYDCALLKLSGVASGVLEREVPRGSGDRLVVWPNPFSSRVHFPPSLRCSVFDQCGRLVAAVRNGTWDGRGPDGRELRAGVYFVTSGAKRPVAVVKLR